MRRQIDGLAILARNVIQRDPLSGAMFAFINARRTPFNTGSISGRGDWAVTSKGAAVNQPAAGNLIARARYFRRRRPSGLVDLQCHGPIGQRRTGELDAIHDHAAHRQLRVDCYKRRLDSLGVVLHAEVELAIHLENTVLDPRNVVMRHRWGHGGDSMLCWLSVRLAKPSRP